MEEQIDILTKDGSFTGKRCPKSEIHIKGYYHNTAHIWFYTKDCHILLAQRAANKTLYPLLWDVSVAGHVDAGETVEDGALREIKEEIGIGINQNELHKIGVFECFQTYENGIIDNEFHHTFIAELTLDLDDLLPQDGEVENLKLVSAMEFSEIIESIGRDNHFIPSNKAYYQTVFDAILERIT